MLRGIMGCIAGCLTLGVMAADGPSKADTGIAVVELFTSEGCSSCPPADRLLGELQATYANKPVFLLSFHVDYWDYIGWRDRFAKPEYTKRQKDYAHALRERTVYTPQMIVNGLNGFVGSDKQQARQSVDQALAGKQNLQIQIKAEGSAPAGKVHYLLNGPLEQGAALHVALVENKASNRVSKGENSGRTLDHINVVRAMETVQIKEHQREGQVSLTWPDDLKADNAAIIAFVQRRHDMKIIGAAQTAPSLAQ